VAATASARPTSAGGSTLRDAALLALCAACLLAARAATPLAAGVFATGLVVLARTGRADRGGLLLAIVGATAVAGMALPFVAERIGRVALLFGRDADFSGRTLVWEFSIGFLRATPWLGFGYGTFWNGGAGIVFWRWSGFPVPHAHNGWLQLALDAGVVATVLLAAAVAGTARRAASLHRAGRPRGAAWVWGFLGLCLAMNLTESFLFVPNDPLTVVLVWTAVAVGLAARGDGGAAPRGASGG
ncbi:MAG TPA: O-antigen ligase family protein, partial [Burkholderiaceae bacterium]|nr:O-antigen ligase family protein [Burkholderiaceae bacterium]